MSAIKGQEFKNIHAEIKKIELQNEQFGFQSLVKTMISGSNIGNIQGKIENSGLSKPVKKFLQRALMDKNSGLLHQADRAFAKSNPAAKFLDANGELPLSPGAFNPARLLRNNHMSIDSELRTTLGKKPIYN
jgi:hypothetical protein